MLAAATAVVKQKSSDSKSASCSTRSKVAVLVRMQNPSEAALERLRAWAEDLQSSKSADLWVSVDTTWEHLRARQRIESAAASWPDDLAASVQFHFYDRDDFLKAYPVFIELLQSISFPVIPGGGHYSGRDFPLRDLGWGFHAEAINLWYQQLSRTAGLPDALVSPLDAYDYVWVFEDDVGFSGDLSILLQRYAEDTSDLITKSYETPKARIPTDWCWPAAATYSVDGWCWYHTNSTYFRERLESCGAIRLASAEHVQRFSRRFLQELHAWSRADAVAWSEMSTPTICRAVPSLRCRTFEAACIGEPFAHNGKVSRQEWAAVLRDREKANRLYHALKF